MKQKAARIFLLAAFLLVVSAAQAQQPVEYELRFGKPSSHLLEVTIRASGLRGPAAEFAMPAWSPGWYVINDYAKLVQEFSAVTPDGKPLPWRKTDKQTWRIELGKATSVVVRYTVYGNTLGVDSTQYNSRHAHISGPATWMYLAGGKERPARLSIEVPAGWRVATGMERSGENKFAAPDFDVFLDSPLEISDYAEKTFEHAGTTYHVIVHDVMGGKDFTKFAEDVQKIVAAEVGLFAPVASAGARQAPFAHYWFLFHVWPGTGGGLEHLNSTQIFLSSDWDVRYEGKIGVTAHEFFHTWNVKRMRPKALGPFDYSRENYTPSLWISEGVTSYYGEMTLMRTGLMSAEDYLNGLSQMISSFERSPGRKERSLEDTSWDTWFWYVGPGRAETNIENVNYSYYTGGQIMGHLLDFAIREATDNRKSLDDWMRLMYQRHALPRPGFTPEEAVRAASEVAGKDMSDFFRRYVSGKEPWPYETYFAYAGIRVEKKTQPDRAWLGMNWRLEGEGRARVTSVSLGGPAEDAGLDRGDLLTAVDGKPISHAQMENVMNAARPGATVRFSVTARDGAQREASITFAAYPFTAFELHPVENPTERQKRIYQGWIGQH